MRTGRPGPPAGRQSGCCAQDEEAQWQENILSHLWKLICSLYGERKWVILISSPSPLIEFWSIWGQAGWCLNVIREEEIAGDWRVVAYLYLCMSKWAINALLWGTCWIQSLDGKSCTHLAQFIPICITKSNIFHKNIVKRPSHIQHACADTHTSLCGL